MRADSIIETANSYIESKHTKINAVNRKIEKIISGIVKAVFLTGFCFVILYPILMMISKAFMNRMDLFDNSVILVPRNYTLQNFNIAMMLMNYWPTLGNTLLLAVLVTALETASCMLVGYGFARFDFKFKNLLFAFVIFTIIVPPQLIMMPMYLEFKNFNPLGLLSMFSGKPLSLLDSYWPFTLLGITAMGTKNGLFIYLFRQFFRNMPKEFEEAAFIDGASSFKTFLKVMVPNAKTSIVTVALFGFVWQYNDVIFTKMFLTNLKVFSNVYESLERFTYAVYQMLGTSQYDMTLNMYYPLVKSTGVLLMLLPLLIIFAFAQRFFVDSIERSGIVG